MPAATPLPPFSAPVREWFTTTFGQPTAAQAQGWPAIAGGRHSLILAPTGSGKTLASFLWGIDRLMTESVPEERTRRTRLVYVSPLRALAVDVEKNLRAPLAGIRLAAERLGVDVHEPTIGMRTGDTSTEERRRLARHPPDLLITTPESLFLLLTSQARENLVNVGAVIVDEIHALAATKRGSHLSLTLERLEHLVTAAGGAPPQRIGLSATQRPLEEIARYLGGFDGRRPRDVAIVDAGVRKALDVEVVVPIEDMGELGTFVEEPVSGPAAAGPVRRSIWPAMHPRLLELIEQHRSTLIFVNARRLAERLATRLNELALEGETHGNDGVGAQGTGFVDTDREVVKAHHGSLSRERRLQIEDELKSGRLKALVCTSSLELGIDMGAVDLVVQVESPRSVAAGLQRVGRAGHQVGAPSTGKLFPKHRADLVEAAVVVDRMHQGLVERTRYPRNPIDVLAQHVVAMVAMDEWGLDDLSALVRRAAGFAELTDEALAATLDLLAGRYPSEEFGELRPRIVWDRVEGTLRARAGAQRLAVTNPGTIPDRGLFGVFLPDGTRVGELDEEMVYESRPGETFLLGASTWRIEDITHDRVVVTPAPGQPGKMPFWHGDGPGRPLELGRAVGEFVREVRSSPAEAAMARLRERHGLDELAARNLLQYLDEQAEATGVVPDDRTIVVERFRDEIGDWRVVVLSPFGAQVHAPWAMALKVRLAERWGMDVELLWSDDGIVLRLPEAVDELPVEELAIDPEDIDELVVSALPQTAMFASRFRECAARALLLPRRRPDRRTPLWQQRQKAADLLSVAGKYPTFPILLEATRECVNDVFDLPALREVLRDLRGRKVRIVAVDTPRASPMAQSLLFGWIAVYMYEGDAPLAERRAAALALDRDLLRDLLGAEELRELLDPAVLADLELELQLLVDGRRARDVDEVHDVVRRLGPLSSADLDARAVAGLDVAAAVAQLVQERRMIRIALPGLAAPEPVDASPTEPSVRRPSVDGGAEPVDASPTEPSARRPSVDGPAVRYAAAEDAARLRDALGVALPVGLPTAFTDPVDAPLVDLVARFARTHGPFVAEQVARAFGVPVERVLPVLEQLEVEGRVVRGEFRPEGVTREWCDDDVLRQLRRRSLAVLRKEVEPVEPAALARFLPAWHGVGSRRRGLDALVEVLGQLQGAALPASALEADILPARLLEYRAADLDALCTAGEVVWVGAGGIGAADGRVRLAFRDQAAALFGGVEVDGFAPGPSHQAMLDHLGQRGASFWPELVRAVADADQPYGDSEVLAALWDLVWAGLVTNDSLAPLRALASRPPRAGGGAGRRSPRGRIGNLARLGPPAAAGRWSLVAPMLGSPASPTEAAHTRASQLLERHGVLTREAALAEGVEGGFAGVYPVLKALEERGRVRRGYFVAGLGAAQFALPGAVDRLRTFRDADDGGRDAEGGIVVLSAVDPAQPYGAALRWPETGGRPSRTAGAHVLLADGEPVAFLERGGHALTTFAATADRPDWPAGLVALLERGRYRSIEVRTVDGQPVRERPDITAVLEQHGWQQAYKGLVRRQDR